MIPDLMPAIWATLFAGAGFAFFGLFLAGGRRRWGWLFPAALGGGLATTFLLVDGEAAGEVIGGQFMAWVSLAFWAVAWVGRPATRWAMIPGWITAVLAAVILLSNQIAGEMMGIIVMIGIGFPFLVLFLRNRDQWWALLPAGVAFSLALIIFFSGFAGGDEWTGRLVGAFLFVGVAIPFLFLWARRDRYQSAWAKYPAGGLLGMGILVLLLGPRMEFVTAVLLIGLGGWMVVEAARRPTWKR
jgi:hypothetical protein